MEFVSGVGPTCKNLVWVGGQMAFSSSAGNKLKKNDIFSKEIFEILVGIIITLMNITFL